MAIGATARTALIAHDGTAWRRQRAVLSKHRQTRPAAPEGTGGGAVSLWLRQSWQKTQDRWPPSRGLALLVVPVTRRCRSPFRATSEQGSPWPPNPSHMQMASYTVCASADPVTRTLIIADLATWQAVGDGTRQHNLVGQLGPLGADPG